MKNSNEMGLAEFQAMLAKAVPTQTDVNNAAILAALKQLGGKVVGEDDLVFKGNKFILPAQFNGDIGAAVKFLRQLDEQLNTAHTFDRTFRYRPYDVAYALGKALKDIFGSTGVGAATQTMFGPIPPSFVTIDVGWGETDQVITGRTAFSPLKAEISVTAANDREVGILGRIIVEAPRRYRAQVEGLFTAIEDQLRNGSIYRGKAINGAENPGFLNTAIVDPKKVIYTAEVLRQLDANIWSLLEHSAAMRKLGLPLKRSVLIEGPFGTGKSLAAALTAQKAIANGWTFIQVRPGDDLEMAMRTAQLYAPAVVFFEDVDGVAEKGDPQDVSRLLDLFDGIAAKGVEVVAVMTTNYPERIQKGMLRPGRMDAVVHVGAMDSDGYRRLIEATVPESLLLDIDYDQVAKAYEGFLPAFAKEANDRALRYAVSRTEGKPDYLTTQDFVDAADGLRPQLLMMQEATEGTRTPTLDHVIKGAMREAIHGIDVVYPGALDDTDEDDANYRLRNTPERLNS